MMKLILDVALFSMFRTAIAEMGDPKTKFLRLFFSALRRPPHPTAHKKFYLTLPLSDVRPGANPIQMFTL